MRLLVNTILIIPFLSMKPCLTQQPCHRCSQTHTIITDVVRHRQTYVNTCAYLNHTIPISMKPCLTQQPCHRCSQTHTIITDVVRHRQTYGNMATVRHMATWPPSDIWQLWPHGQTRNNCLTTSVIMYTICNTDLYKHNDVQ